MPYFVVLVHGRGFELSGDGPPSVGFFTSRSVRALDADDAGRRACALLRRQWARPPYRAVRGADGLMLEVESVHPHGWWQHLRFRNRGYSFYPAEPG